MVDPRESELRARILAELQAAPAPTRSGRRARALGAAALSIAALGAVLSLHGLEGLRQRPAGYVLVVLLGLGALAVALGRRVARALSSPLPRDVGRLAGLARRAPALWALSALAGTLVAPGTWGLALVSTPLAEGMCFGTTLVCALLLVACAATLYRGSLVRDAGPVASGLCALAGTLAAFAISFACTLPGLGHVLLGHVLPVVLLLFALAPLLARALRMSGPR
jgi:hypothetical protein